MENLNSLYHSVLFLPELVEELLQSVDQLNDLAHCAEVNRIWNLEAERREKYLWENLKKEFIDHKVTLLNHVENLNKNASASKKFRFLWRMIAPYKTKGPTLFHTPLYFTNVRQLQQDMALETVWRQSSLKGRIARFVEETPDREATAANIRDFLQRICSPLVLEQIGDLNLNECKLTLVPELHFFPRISLIYLIDNHIEQIPGLPQQLKALYLATNMITDLPNLPLPELKILDVSGNQIQAVPNCEHMQSLEVMNLSDNQIHTFPQFETLPNLWSLDLRNNQIRVIPDTIPQMFPGLTILDLRGNPIEEIPDFGQLMGGLEVRIQD